MQTRAYGQEKVGIISPEVRRAKLRILMYMDGDIFTYETIETSFEFDQGCTVDYYKALSTAIVGAHTPTRCEYN